MGEPLTYSLAKFSLEREKGIWQGVETHQRDRYENGEKSANAEKAPASKDGKDQRQKKFKEKGTGEERGHPMEK